MAAVLVVLGLFASRLASADIPLKQLKMGKRKVVLTCYSSDNREFMDACQRVKKELEAPSCQPPVEVIQLSTNPTVETASAELAKHYLPPGTLFLTMGHGLEQARAGENDKHLEERLKRPAEHHLVVPGEILLWNRKGTEGIHFPRGVPTGDLVKEISRNWPEAPQWIMSCRSGGLCETHSRLCLGTSCSRKELTSASSDLDFVDWSTWELVRLYCDKKKFDEVDARDKRDGRISGKEFVDHLCDTYPPYLEFYLDIKDFDAGLARLRRRIEWEFSPDAHKRLARGKAKIAERDRIADRMERGLPVSAEEKARVKELLKDEDIAFRQSAEKELLRLPEELRVEVDEVGNSPAAKAIRALYPKGRELHEGMVWKTSDKYRTYRLRIKNGRREREPADRQVRVHFPGPPRVAFTSPGIRNRALARNTTTPRWPVSPWPSIPTTWPAASGPTPNPKPPPAIARRSPRSPHGSGWAPFLIGSGRAYGRNHA